MEQARVCTEKESISEEKTDMRGKEKRKRERKKQQ